MLTRRDTVKAILAGTALPLLPVAAEAAPDWRQAFLTALDRHLVPDSEARFTLHRFDVETAAGQIRMTGVVGLDWPPGQMRRRFMAEAATPEDAYARLEAQALANFCTACPGTVV